MRSAFLIAACLALSCAWLPASTQKSETNFFGFKGPETFPIDNFIGNLRVADLDGDGLNDVVVANNSRSKITLLYNQTGKTNSPDARRKRVKLELNELPPDARFRIESIASEKRIAGLVVADLNGDNKTDIAYYGEPKELVVQYNQGSNLWSNLKRWPIDDGQLTPNALTHGDLNGDKRTDLVLLGDNVIYWLAQTRENTLAEAERIPYSGAVKSVQVLDINGDERDDLLLVNWENANPFRFRLQNEAGQLGPEMHFSLPPIRSYWADDLDGDSKTEVITIAQNSGRAQISNFKLAQAEPLVGSFREGQFSVLPLIKTTKAKRGAAWADINGDGLADLLVAEPDSGQLTVFLQNKNGTFSESKSFPTLTGVTEVAVARDGAKVLIYVLSSDERQVALSQYDGGRIAFPTALPLEGRPLAMAVLQEGAKATLAVILDRDDKRFLHIIGADGSVKTQLLSETFKSNPATLAWHDANQDGLADLIALIPYEKIKLLIQGKDRDFEETDVSPPGGSVEQPWLSAVDVDGDGKNELLLAQKNFVRAVVARRDTRPDDAGTNRTWSFTVKDQISGASGTSRIVGAAPLRSATNKVPSLFLLDAERKALTLCERDSNGVWQVVRNVLLPFTEFNSLHPLAVGGGEDGGARPAENSVGFLGVNAVAWMALAGQTWQFSELDGYETPIKDGHLHDVVSGDLDQDKRKDLVFLETGRNHLDLVIFDKHGKLIPATRWQVFEERTFRGRRSDQPEPREAMIVDVTGDKRNDLVVIVHDRVLVYPQE